MERKRGFEVRYDSNSVLTLEELAAEAARWTRVLRESMVTASNAGSILFRMNGKVNIEALPRLELMAIQEDGKVIIREPQPSPLDLEVSQ